MDRMKALQFNPSLFNPQPFLCEILTMIDRIIIDFERKIRMELNRRKISLERGEKIFAALPKRV